MTKEESFFRESTGQRFGEINMKIVTPEMIFKAMKGYVTNNSTTTECTFLVGSQFCPKCNPTTYGNNMVQVRLDNEKCSSCGYMISNHMPFSQH